MNKYLLLRDNKQTGPHSFEEMLELGFKKYDLVWVEGKSAAWRYPGEVSEFASYAPLVEEQPFDRFYKRPSESQVAGGRLQVAALTDNIPSEANIATEEGVKHAEIEKRREALIENKQKQEYSKYLPKEKTEPVNDGRGGQTSEPITNTEERVAHAAERHRKVAITMPATRRSAPVVTPQPKKQEPEPRFITVPAAAPVIELKSDDVPPIASPQMSSGSYTRDHTQFLQYAGVAAALISLLVVGILIGMSISTDTSTPVPAISEQPSRITELKEKLAITAAAEPTVPEVQDVTPVQKTAKASSINTAAEKNSIQLKEATPVPASYQTSSAPAPVDNDGKREAVKREAAVTSNISEKISLNLNDYKVNMFGGIDGIEVSVKNGADVPVEEVVVELRYILSNRNKKYLTETVTFRDLKPGETKTLPGPKSNRGIKLESYIVSAN